MDEVSKRAQRVVKGEWCPGTSMYVRIEALEGLGVDTPYREICALE